MSDIVTVGFFYLHFYPVWLLAINRI